MASIIAQVMTDTPETVEATDTIHTTAQRMRDCDCGAMLVTEDGRVLGIVTDRDLVVRGLAAGLTPDTAVRSVISTNVHGVAAEASIQDAATIMRDHSIRRLAVVDEGALVGVVSLGDLALAADEKSALADISAAPANH